MSGRLMPGEQALIIDFHIGKVYGRLIVVHYQLGIICRLKNVSLSEFSLPQDHANLQPDSVLFERGAIRSVDTKVVKRSRLAIVQGYVGNI